MTIKNRDGTTFRLNKPNPIMRQQDFWDDGSKFTLHNFNGGEVILHNFEQEKEEPKVIQEEPKKKKFQKIEDIVPQEIEVQIKESPVPAVDKARKKPLPKNVILIYCMPATSMDTHDPLYNENRVSVSYGSQFTFQAIVTNSNDLTLQLWTTVGAVTRNSILYMPQTRRWWKVENVSIKKDEYLLDCMPSSLQPSFATL